MGTSANVKIYTSFIPQKPGSTGTIDDVLQPGHAMVAAGYTM